MTNILRKNNSKITSIPEYLFISHDCQSVSSLFLSFDQLMIVQEFDFVQFSNLNTLSLITNRLILLDSACFEPLLNLETLYLEMCSLLEIPENLFWNLCLLKKLSLIVPNLRKIPKLLIAKNLSINHLKMDFTCLLNKKFLLSLTNIEYLDWRTTSKTVMFRGSHLVFKKLKTLKLSNRAFKEDDFNSLPNLRRIIVNRSKLLDNTIDNILKNQYLEAVDLSDNVNIRILNFEWKHLWNPIKYFSANCNFICDISNTSFRNFQSLKTLDLSHNCLKSIDCNLFAELYNLCTLNIGYNVITDVEWILFQNLVNLEVLNLSYNSIESNESFFAINLRNINFSFNRFEVLKCKLDDVNLEIFDLQGNCIQIIADEYFASVRNLKYLYLNSNSISCLNQNHFSRLDSLLHLNLSHNFIRYLDYELFSNLKSLRILNLSHNLIKFLPVYLFRKTARLEFLDLSSNKISVIQGNLFQYNRYLTHLYLRNNCLSVVANDIFMHSYFVMADLVGNRFVRFSKYVILKCRNLNCCYVFDRAILQLLTNLDINEYKIFIDDNS